MKDKILTICWEYDPRIMIRASECRGLPEVGPMPFLRLRFPEGDVPGLLLDHEGISGLFHFSSQPYNVFIPWHAVLAIESGLGYFLFKPVENIRAEFPADPEPSGVRSRLRLIPGGKE